MKTDVNYIRQVIHIVWNEDGDFAADYTLAEAADRLSSTHGGTIFGSATMEVMLPRPIVCRIPLVATAPPQVADQNHG